MKTAITEPATLQEFGSIMFRNRSRVDVRKISDVVYTLLEEHIYKGHSFETCWALWLAKIFNIKILPRIAANLFEFIDSSSLIMALDLRKQGLIASNTKTGALQDLFDKDSLETEHWLLVYEAIYHKWITPKDPRIVDDHPFFSLLKKNYVSFYHTRRVIKKLQAQQYSADLYASTTKDETTDLEALLAIFKHQGLEYI